LAFFYRLGCKKGQRSALNSAGPARLARSGYEAVHYRFAVEG